MRARKTILTAFVLGLLFLVGCEQYSDSDDVQTAQEPSVSTRTATTGTYGLYCWGDIDDLTSLAQQAQVGEVYYAVPGLTATPTAQDIKSCATAIENCQRAGISVWLLAGDPSWGTDETGTEIKKTVEAVAAYNQSARVPLAGVQLTVNPYALAEWADNPAKVADAWYKALKAGYDLAAERGVKVMICLPRWLDTLSAQSTPNGIQGDDLLEKLVRDCCDELAVMCCYRGAEVDDLVTEALLAEVYGKRLVCVSDLSAPDGDITENNTYRTAGLNELYAAWSAVKEAYPSVGFAYHHAAALSEMLHGGE